MSGMEGMVEPGVLGAAAAGAAALAAGIARWRRRRRLRAALGTPRRWEAETLRRWRERGWLQGETGVAEGVLPETLSPARLFLEWARADLGVAVHWRFSGRVSAESSLEALVREVWANLPEAARAATSERLAEALRAAGSWWGGAERGWNGRPYLLPASALPRRAEGLPLIGLEDMTAAPEPLPVCTEAAAVEIGPDSVLFLAALRRARFTFVHPLASGEPGPAAGMARQLIADLGRRIGAGLGGALGPLGAMLGQTLGEKAAASGALWATRRLSEGSSDPASQALAEAEAALAALGEALRSVGGDALERAAREPERRILELGGALERARAAQARQWTGAVWAWLRPGVGPALFQACLGVALEELRGYRAAAEPFLQAARKAPGGVAGALVMQNPWLARHLPDGVARLNAARAALNRAALALRRRP